MTTRRVALKCLLASGALLKAGALAAQSRGAAASIRRDVPYRRIATEEAYSTPEIVEMYRALLATNPADEPGFAAMWGAFLNRDPDFFEQLNSLGERRLRDMDSMGIDMHVLSLTAPGVQVFDAATATSVARSTNDQLAEACRNNPTRFAGLTTIAPHDPANAAKEIERGMTELGLKGIIVSSHTKGEYLDDQKYWEILEAAEAFDAPIYIHPRTPAPSMLEPWLERGFHGPLGGFAADVYLHTLGIVTSGAFDRFPNLKIVIGHLGEGLPYVMYRLDYMQRQAGPLERRISDYLKDNVYVTTSGMAWEPAIKFAQQVLGERHVLYAMDYPYQFDAEEVRITDELDITDEAKKRLYQTNAEELFSL
ncbi:MAG: amidohydrolase [Gammaproteobacteria bacterium]|nr:amidohydrolase [Gammaproteobacteria bacterium]